MLVAWMAYATLLTALLAAGGIAAESAARIWSTPRRLVWLMILIVAMAAPPLLAIRPATRTAAPTSIAPVSFPPSRPTSNVAPIPRAERRSSPVTRVTLASSTPVVTQLAPYVVTAWLAASLALFGMFALAVLRLRVQSRSWRDAIVDDVPVLVSSDIGPAVIGTMRPRIVVAEWTLALDDSKRALMLRHELEHIRARDPILLRLATLSLVVFPWNAALWFVVRRLRQSIEIDCDSRVLGAIDPASDAPRDYGMLLLLVGARRATPLPTAAGFTGYPPFLERRIKAMTTQPPRRPTLLSLGLLSLTVASTVAATRAPLPATLRPMRHATTVATRRSQAAIPRTAVASSPGIAPLVIDSTPAEDASATAPSLALPPLMVVDTDPVPTSDASWRPGFSFEPAPPQGRATSREASGRVLDSATNSPLPNVYVRVIGIQALNEPNWTCSDANGVFRLRVPVGEAWLSAQSADHMFSRLTLAATDSVGVLRGAFIAVRPAQPGPAGDRIASMTVTRIRPASDSARTTSDPLIFVDGVRQPPGDSVHLSIRTVNGGFIETDWNTASPRPKFVIDGVELDWNQTPTALPNPCAK